MNLFHSSDVTQLKNQYWIWHEQFCQSPWQRKTFKVLNKVPPHQNEGFRGCKGEDNICHKGRKEHKEQTAGGQHDRVPGQMRMVGK